MRRKCEKNHPAAKPPPAVNTLTHPDAAGIDVGAEEFVVAVRQAAAKNPSAPTPLSPAVSMRCATGC